MGMPARLMEGIGRMLILPILEDFHTPDAFLCMGGNVTPMADIRV